MQENSLVNLGNTSKPVSTFIEKISDAVTGIAKPWQIRRVAEAEADEIRTIARAEADAALIVVEKEFQITDRHREAFFRLINEEAVKQSIMQNIVLKAIPNVNPDDAKPEDMEDDWIRNFFDKCRIVSDEDVQNLWSRVLAGEANNPGSFSRRTVNLMADLDKRDAELFMRLCSFVWMVETQMCPLVIDVNDEIYDSHGISFSSLGQLEALGLVRLEGGRGLQITKLPKHINLTYFGRATLLSLPKDSGNNLAVGDVMLTQAGRQLSRICEATAVDGFFEYVCQKWIEKSIKVEWVPLPGQ